MVRRSLNHKPLLSKCGHIIVVSQLLAVLVSVGCLTGVNLLRPQHYLECHVETKL
jgi:hypothetical protein